MPVCRHCEINFDVSYGGGEYFGPREIPCPPIDLAI